MAKKKRVKKNSKGILNEYKNSFNYLKESQNYIYAVMILFLISALVGYFATLPTAITSELLKAIQELIAKTEGMSGGELIIFIFLNNLEASFLGIVFGVLIGIFPILAAVFNGFLVGFVGKIAVQEGGAVVLFRLLPHGIFELPAIFISFGLGLTLGINLFKHSRDKLRLLLFYAGLIFLSIILRFLNLLLISSPFRRSSLILFTLISLCSLFFILVADDRKLLLSLLRDSIKVFVLIVIPLLVVAAIIEGLLIALAI